MSREAVSPPTRATLMLITRHAFIWIAAFTWARLSALSSRQTGVSIRDWSSA